MRMLLGIIIASLCVGVVATPARAIGDLKNCDAIKDAGERMACLYAHIAHLEQTLLSLSTDIIDLRHELKEKLGANAVYKLQYVGKGNCLGFAEKDKAPVMASCDRPDSWKLVRGAQSPGAGSAAPKAPSPDKSTDKPQRKSGDKSQAQDKSTDKPQGKSTDQPKAVPQPN